MKEILTYVEQKKQEFSRLPFFVYLQDQSISPKQRLAFAPCTAPFIMSFGELNRSVFRDEPTNDPIQEIINQHTYEDDHHWVWFLEDLEKLALNPTEPFTNTLKFLWSEETRVSRRLTHEIYRHTFNAKPIQKLVVIESIEATGNTALKVTSQVIKELQIQNGQSKQHEYRFFGTKHLIVDTGHTYCSPENKKLIESIQLTEESKYENLAIVNYIFEIFSEFTDELLTYAKIHRFDQSVSTVINQRTRYLKPIGSYLTEAGLVSNEQLQSALGQQKLTPIPIGHLLVSQGLIKQKTIEFLVEKVINSERQLTNPKNVSILSHGKPKEEKDSIVFPTGSVTPFIQPMRLGAYLVEAALINSEQLESALKEQQVYPMPLGQILSRNGIVNQQTIEYLIEKVVQPECKVSVLS